MRVIVFMKATKESEAGEMPSEALLTEMMAYNEQLVNAGVLESGEGLHPTSRGARVVFRGAEREVVTGPFGGDPSDLVAGFWIWNVGSFDEAIEWAKKCPNPMDGGGMLEIRPFFTAEDFGAELTPELREQEDRLRELVAAR
jgi:hypothetical protein